MFAGSPVFAEDDDGGGKKNQLRVLNYGGYKLRNLINRLVGGMITCIACSHVLFAAEITQISDYSMAEYDAVIVQLYDNLEQQTFSERLDYFSQYFLGKPYQLGPLGEGEQALFDQGPLYRTDEFDCLTYVETVLALAFSQNLEEFKQTLLALRYEDAQPKFVARNHFMTVDWNPNNIHNGYVQDITYQFVDVEGQPIAEVADAVIDKPSWYRHFTAANIQRLDNPSAEQTQQLLAQFHTLADQVQAEKGILLYVPLSQLFDAEGQPNLEVFAQIPDDSIVQIVRPNWDISEKIGTNLNVSHVGFGLRQNGELIYREASLTEGKVMDIPLVEYLKKYLDSPTIKGINVLVITEQAVRPKSGS